MDLDSLVNLAATNGASDLHLEAGLPAVEVEGDPCDAHFYSSADFNTKIDSFMEILMQRERRRW